MKKSIRMGEFIRPKRTAIEFAGTVLLVCALLLAGGAFAQPNQPPERIWHKDARVYNDAPRTDNFYDWTWIGDQNGDGCDELLICQEPRIWELGLPRDNLNQVELFLGNRNEMSQESAFIFETDDSLESIGRSVAYLGALTGRDAHDFAITTAKYYVDEEGRHLVESYAIEIYRGGEGRFDTEPDYVMRRQTARTRGGHRYYPGRIDIRPTVSPFDINGDGYNDLLVWSEDTTAVSRLEIYFGGEDFDTIPDFTSQDTRFNQSGDFNGDGFDDLFVFDWRENDLVFFLGSGNPTDDSIRTLSIDHMEGYNFYGGVPSCPDVDGDGCDDWVMQAYQDINNPFSSTVMLFFGSDSLDAEPDRTLQIDPFPENSGNHGGHANDDRYGDIISHRSDTRYFFGSDWVNESPGVIFEAGFNETQGAYGDFNGDGVDDCVFRYTEEHGYEHYLEIYASNPDWVVSVGDEGLFPIPKEFTASAHPNPFNNLTVVTFVLPARGNLTVHLCDLNGREVKTIDREIFAPGAQSVVESGEGLPSGVYYLEAKLQSSTGQYITNLKLTHIN